MPIETWLSFCALVSLMVATPGPSVLIGMSHSLRYGPRPTMITALGDVTANMIQMVIAAVGLGALLATSATAFGVVKWCGVAFLFVIGVTAILRKSKAGNDSNDIEMNSASGFEPVRKRRLFSEGFLVAAGNPKAIAFFGALFPQFIDPSAELLPQLMILGTTFVIFDYTFVMIYAMGAARLMPWLIKRGGKNTIGRVSGGVLIVAALLLSLIDMPESIAKTR
ncbi:MAG: homoserine lactone transporter [Thalassospira sp.]|uniref:LysE family translocator n=1 Tax=Thalassospira sp. TaxID=1912094 RepID=UPI000C3E110B|nr:LysE family translocator [Thalassospira sp.]MAZ35564.1 homoserine lactone transporter [Thalassospira sp.]|tara:strand:+ start:497 stop:1165 length:669 start_codon:yes stop_codon:yes gene_type:complete